MDPITLSVILDCRHDAAATGFTLSSLLATLSGLESEIFLLGEGVDQPFTPPMDPDLISIRTIPENGWEFFLSFRWKEICRGDYILYLTPGVVWGEETLRNWLFAMEENDRIGSISGKLLDGMGNFIPASRQTFPKLWDKIRGKSGHPISDGDPDRPLVVEMLPPVNVLFRRKALEENYLAGIPLEKAWNELFRQFGKTDWIVSYQPQRFLVYRALTGVIPALKSVKVKKRRLLVISREDSFEEIRREAVKRMPELEFVNLWDLGENRVMDAICRRNRMKGFTDILFCYPEVRYEQMSLFAESLPATSTCFHIYNRNDRQLISPENSYAIP